ncbi:MAG TPA: DUF262 domain-containing HNH endonuclease family protein [Pseudomonadota bacterium]|jgi:hypothetical protein|nr:DUF262 domain-containing HNH endonuclease family protein [Pseudomonadota bacterium]
MATGALLQTKDVNLREVLANGKQYEVPPFQRDYSWTEEHWEELWLDLIELKASRPHYMGALVLQALDQSERYRVIDGQQRLATLSLLVIAALHCLQELIDTKVDAESNQKRRDNLRSVFLGAEHPVTLRTSPKLKLNSANHRFYEGTLLALCTPVSVRSLPAAEKLLWQGMKYFQGKLKEKYVNQPDGAGLASFVYDLVGSKLLFIQILVQDELSAYTVFETLNARGMELTSADLLKNYLFSIVHPTGDGPLRTAQSDWQEISERIPAKEIPEFLRHYLNSRMPNIRKERVYKTLRTEITDARGVFDWLGQLKEAALLVGALEDETAPLWEEDELREARPYVQRLLLYRVTQYRPLVLAGWRKLPHKELPLLLRYCDAIAFRYSVITQRNPNRLEDFYNKIAVQLEKGDITKLEQVRDQLQSMLVSDEEFREAFAKRAISADGQQKKLVRFILCALEKQAHNHDVDFATTTATIEHILPKHAEREWEKLFTSGQRDRFVERLGNYLLLEPKLNNRRAGNGPLQSKLAEYAKSQYPSTRDFSVSEWSPAAIEARQQKMARMATAIWGL